MLNFFVCSFLLAHTQKRYPFFFFILPLSLCHPLFLLRMPYLLPWASCQNFLPYFFLWLHGPATVFSLILNEARGNVKIKNNQKNLQTFPSTGSRYFIFELLKPIISTDFSPFPKHCLLNFVSCGWSLPDYNFRKEDWDKSSTNFQL